MATRSALDTLIELAQRDTDEAAKRLGVALRGVDEAQQKLTMLHGYREDYAVRFDAAQLKGITPAVYFNFVAFLEKLDNAVKGQQEVLRHAQRRADQEKEAWQACERKRLSFRTLSERAAAEALAKENKRDQKMMDEYATRQAFYKR
jgi:flagellar FliJ protein